MKAAENYSIRVVSPLHMGCDEDYEPTGFVLDAKRLKLISFDPLDFINSLGDREKARLIEICRKGTIGSVIELYRFMQNKTMHGKETEITTGFVEHWQKTLGLNPQDEKKVRQELNQFGIARTAYRSIDQRPYIPGSAIKGALRTAYLNTLAEGRNVGLQQKEISSRDLERKLLEGSFESDPFRMLKVSDFHPLGTVKTKILYAVNKKKKPSKFGARGPSQILEIIESGSLFGGTIKIEAPPNGSNIKKPLSREALLNSAGKFFFEAFQREEAELKAIGAQPFTVEKGNAKALLRLGRHSGAESVTLEKHRTIRIMQGKGKNPKFENKATTLWLAANSRNPLVDTMLRPFGWVILQEGIPEWSEDDEIDNQKNEDHLSEAQSVVEGEKSGEDIKPSQHTKSEIWEGASLEWRAGSQEIIATFKGKKAFGKDLVIKEEMKKKITGRKTVLFTVEVEPIGNRYRIVQIVTENA